MSTPDDEFDDFLRARKPLFDRSHDDDALEPPADLDRVVLRQAREAIEAPRPQRVYRAPRWSAPLAVAATLAVAFTVVLQLMPKHPQGGQPTAAEISLQKASRPVDAPADSPAVAANDAIADEADGAVIVQLDPSAAEPMVAQESRAEAFVSEAEADRYAAAPPPPIPTNDRNETGAASGAATSTPARRVGGRVEMGKAPVAAAAATPVPEYRREEKSWLAEIERLRTSGDVMRADAELAEYKRQHRAYAVAPDR